MSKRGIINLISSLRDGVRLNEVEIIALDLGTGRFIEETNLRLFLIRENKNFSRDLVFDV